MNRLRFLIYLAFLFLACSKGGDGNEEPVAEDPTAVQLEFPVNNSECITGVDQENNRFLVEFKWLDSSNDSYELVVENLTTNNLERYSSNSNTKSVSLIKNTPYEWYVISKNVGSSDEAKSQKWKFYTAGDGVQNYAPFPADLLSPENNVLMDVDSQNVTLEWETTDIDDEELSYTLYVGGSNPPEEVVAQNLVEPQFDLNLEQGTELYWRVETLDEGGNSSWSKVRKITVDGGSGLLSLAITEEGITYSAQINSREKTINISLGNFPYEKLRPQIQLKPGYSISPESNVQMNFHDDLFYTVTDPNGNEVVYNVIVESGQHEIESFEVINGNETYIGLVNQQEGKIYIEMGNFDYGSITPVIEVSPKASVVAEEVTNIDLTAPYSFVITSEKGTTKEYTVSTKIGMTALYSYFRNPGFEFLENNHDTGYKVFAGSTQYIYAQNIQDVSQTTLQLINANNETFSLPIERYSYFHQHSFEDSSSQNYLTTVIPDNLPSGMYSLIISENARSRAYPHTFEVINDDRVVRITEINGTDFTRGDTLIIKGTNLRKEFMVKTDGEYHTFNQYVYDLELNQDSTEIRLPFSTNTYNRLKSWTGNNEKPLAIQSTIDGYEHQLNSNVVYFNVN